MFYSTLLIFFSAQVFAQSKGEVRTIEEVAVNLEKAIKSKNEQAEAAAYVELGDLYINRNDYARSENYYLKGRALYERLKNPEQSAVISRKLGVLKEKQRDNEAAASYYSKAAEASRKDASTELNLNDAKRVSSKSVSKKKSVVAQNMQINAERKNNNELAQDYQNMAEINVQQNNIPEATKNLETAYDLSKKEAPEKALEINKKTVDLLVDQNDFSQAIEKKKEVLEEDFIQQNSLRKVTQLQELADVYLKSNDQAQAAEMFRKSYELALAENHTRQAHRSLMKLDSLYTANGDTGLSLSLYRDFLSALPQILEKDSTLVNAQTMKNIEERIARLENEKLLQQELLQRRNLINYLLIAGLLLAFGFIVYALLTQNKLRRQNKKIELQSLRREMNPHFIFNSLNSVNQFIAENNELEANAYLTKFSKLMRGVMENSKNDFIPLSRELTLLTNYLDLEKSRFQDKFDYQISVDPELVTGEIMIPGMLIQPFLENAVWHGLRYRSDSGYLNVHISNGDHILTITIEDNGIGIGKSTEQKTDHQKQHNGRGMKNTLERIQLLNDLYHRNISCDVTDKQDGDGVLVTLKMKYGKS